jgi:hypothetical protein
VYVELEVSIICVLTLGIIPSCLISPAHVDAADIIRSDSLCLTRQARVLTDQNDAHLGKCLWSSVCLFSQLQSGWGHGYGKSIQTKLRDA